MHSIDLILLLAAAFSLAVVCGYLTNRAGLSPIVGYLIAGLVIGPYTPGFVANQHLAEQLAEVGVILLMFGVGLQFHLDELLAVRNIAIPGAIVQSAVATGLGVLVARFAGWPLSAGIVFGIALSVASTVVLVRILADNRHLHTKAGRIAVGWIVVEDIFTVVVLVLLPAAAGASAATIAVTIVIAVLKIAVLAAFTMTVGGRLIPWLLTHIARTRSRELFTLTVLALALGIAVAAAKLFGASMALGAFLAGMVVGRSEFSVRSASEALPMRDAFAVVFFVSIGMLLDPEHLLRAPGLIALTLAVVVVGKPAAALLISVLMRQPLQVALPVSIVLSQIGEFSFIVASLANSLGLLPPEATQTLVATAIVSITLNPILYRGGQSIVRRQPAIRTTDVSLEPAHRSDKQEHAIIIGYGPVGRTVTRLLQENGIGVSVIDMNVETVRALQAGNVHAVYGDGSTVDALIAAGVSDASGLIVSVAGMTNVEEAIRLARERNASIRVMVRTNYLEEARAIKRVGADLAFSGEGEVALAFTAAILQSLGSTADQIERERARVHAELG
jgi:CPA2 family monovalent cation:H+ antiporter-2